MSRTLLITLLMFLLALPALAQDKVAKNAIYAELTGWALPSVNYERVVWQRAKHQLGARVGLLIVPGRTDTNRGAFPARRTTGWVVPLGANYLKGSGPHRLELGAQYFFVQHQALEGGRAVLNPSDPNAPAIPVFDNTVLITNRHQLVNLRVGYRYQKLRGGPVFRAGITPVNWFLAGRENFTFGAAGIVLGEGQRNNVVFFPLPDISIGWSF